MLQLLPCDLLSRTLLAAFLSLYFALPPFAFIVGPNFECNRSLDGGCIDVGWLCSTGDEFNIYNSTSTSFVMLLKWPRACGTKTLRVSNTVLLYRGFLDVACSSLRDGSGEDALATLSW